MAALPPKNQIPQTWLADHVAQIEACLTPYLQAFHEQQINGAELTAIYLLIFNRLWRKELWTAGRFCLNETVPASQITLGNLSNQTKIDFGFDPNCDVITFLNQHRLRGVSLRAQRAIICWQAKMYPIQLRFDLPNPETLLAEQAQGHRIVSLLIKPNQLAKYTLGRDPFTFALHDLEHADEFFHDPLHRQEQISIYQCLHKALNQGLLNDFLQADPIFKSDWNYLIADMNSHPAHLKATLRAVLYQSRKRMNHTNRQDRLPREEENLIETLMGQIFTPLLSVFF